MEQTMLQLVCPPLFVGKAMCELGAVWLFVHPPEVGRRGIRDQSLSRFRKQIETSNMQYCPALQHANS